MQLAMESKEQQLRAQSSFEEGLRAKLSTGSPSFLGEQAAPVSQRRGKLGSLLKSPVMMDHTANPGEDSACLSLKPEEQGMSNERTLRLWEIWTARVGQP